MRTVTGAYDDPAHPDADQEPYGPYDSYDTYDDPVGSDADGARPARRQGDDPARHAYYPGRRLNLGVVLLPAAHLPRFHLHLRRHGQAVRPRLLRRRRARLHGQVAEHPAPLGRRRAAAPVRPPAPGRLRAGDRLPPGRRRRADRPGLLAAGHRGGRRPALRRADRHRQLEDRPRLRRPGHHLPRRLVSADHRRRPRLLRGRPARGQRLAPARPPLRHLGAAPLRPAPRRADHRGHGRPDPADRLAAGRRGPRLQPGGRPRSRRGPRNHLPGSPLPQEPGERRPTTPSASSSPTGGATAGATPSGAATTPGTSRATSGATTAAPTQTQGTTGQVPPRQTAPTGGAPSTTAGPTSTGGGGTSTSGATTGGSTSTGGGSTSTGQPGLVGGLLG